MTDVLFDTEEEDLTFKTLMEHGGRDSPVVRGGRLAMEAMLR